MTLSAVAAMASNRVIGTQGGLPWSIPEDMKFFKEKTAGHVILMGRKTFDSFKGRLLPKRLHVVISRQADYRPLGAHVFPSVEAALEFCREMTAGEKATPGMAPQSESESESESELMAKLWPQEVFVIGGGEIYQTLLPYTARVYLTEIHQEFKGDAQFPPLPAGEFREVERRARPGPPKFDFVTYQRIR